jgi:DNA-binding NarL/FixJ family response regulator
MSKIFLLEPHRVLQQAIALSLFPEHDVQVAEAAGAAAIDALKDDIDLVIVDAAALREGDKLSAEMNRAIEASPVPIVWIDDGDSPHPKRDKLAVVLKPIESGALQTALADLLAPANAHKERKASPRKGKAGSDPELIDLTEVVEEEPFSETKSPTKSE